MAMGLKIKAAKISALAIREAGADCLRTKRNSHEAKQ